MLFNSTAIATTYYVDGTNGSDTFNSGLSASDAKSTITSGLSLLDAGAPGDVLLILDGIYRERLEISASGNSSAYKVVRAQNPGQVVIDGEFASWRKTLIISGDYIKIEGLKFINGGESVGLISSSSDHAYIKNSAFINADATNAYATVFRNNGTYALIEDSWFAGGGRYLVIDSAGQNSVYRRVVGRWDYSTGTQPIGGFMNYHEQAIGGGYNAVYQNVIAIDFNDPIGHNTWLTGGFADKYGHNVIKEGCIAMNILSSASTGVSASAAKVGQKMLGFFDEPSQQDGRNGTNVYNNCASIGNYRGFRQVRAGNTIVTNFTAIDSTTEAVGRNASTVPFSNSLFANNGGSVDTTGSYSYSHFQNETARGDNSTTGDAGLLNPVGVEASSAVHGTGSGGANRGATILKRIGVDGTHYGDPGWDTVTDIDLWPFPNETRICDDFRAVPPPPSGAIPVTSNSSRGFCANGQTLTKYIFEALGNTAPINLIPAKRQTDTR